MFMALKRYVLWKEIMTILFLFFSDFISAQSPWVPKKASGYVHISLGIIPTYNQVFQGNQTQVKTINSSITEWSTQVYGEVGVAKNWSLQLSIPYQYITSSENNNSNSISGIGNIGWSIKQNILNKGIVAAWQLQVNLPAFSTNQQIGLRTGYEAFSFIPTFNIGQGFDQAYYYFYTGIGMYTNQLSNDYRFGGEVGKLLFKKLWTVLSIGVRERWNTKNIDENDPYLSTYSYVNNQSYTNFALKFIYQKNDNWGINGSTNILSIRANNLPFQRPFSLGIYYKW